MNADVSDEVVLRLTRTLVRKHGIRNLCLAGGVAADRAGVLDFSLGFGTSALTHMKVIAYNIMPADSVSEQYVFHPLLQATPNPNFVDHLPVEIRHNSQGLRGPERDQSA